MTGSRSLHPKDKVTGTENRITGLPVHATQSYDFSYS
jgi:hypothetical protein